MRGSQREKFILHSIHGRPDNYFVARNKAREAALRLDVHRCGGGVLVGSRQLTGLFLNVGRWGKWERKWVW